MKEEKSIFERMSSKNIAFIGLISIFVILLLQSALSLFFELPFEELGQIDIIFRTSISSIFGYIMSMVSTSDFVINPKSTTKVKKIQQPKTIGFKANEEKVNATMVYNIEDETKENIQVKAEIIKDTVVENKALPSTFRVNAQIIVLTSACIFCLVIMLIVRNFSSLIAANSSASSTFSMFRDIISGSIGALIGLSKSNN